MPATHRIKCTGPSIPVGSRLERTWVCICGQWTEHGYDKAVKQGYREHLAESTDLSKHLPQTEPAAVTSTPEASLSTESLARITDLDARIEVMQDRLASAVDYATIFRTADDAESVEACERAIRLANMLSQAILATAVRRTS